MMHFHNPFHWTHLPQDRKAIHWGESLCGKWTQKRTTVTGNVTCSKCKSHVSFQKIIRERAKRKRMNLGRYCVIVMTTDSGWIHRKWQERRPSLVKAQNTLSSKSRSKKFVMGCVYDSITNLILNVKYVHK